MLLITRTASTIKNGQGNSRAQWFPGLRLWRRFLLHSKKVIVSSYYKYGRKLSFLIEGINLH